MQPTPYTRIAQQAPFFDEGHGYDVFGLHPPSLAGLLRFARPIYERYFRVDSLGIASIPATGPAIVVANHGGVLPVDGAILCIDLLLRSEPPRIPRPVSDRFVPRLPLVSTLFSRVGVVSGTRTNVRRLLERGELVVIWPEGVAGPAKPFYERYGVRHWTVGFAELAIRYGAPVIPVAVLGAEESWPVLLRLRRLRLFGTPYLPVPASPLPLPAHYHIRYGAPIRFRYAAEAADDPNIVAHAAEEVRAVLQRMIGDARDARRGVFR